MSKILIFLTFFLMLFDAVNSQTFTASVNNTTVSTNEPFEVSFEFHGDEINSIQDFRAPDFKNFHVLSGPNQSTSMQIINGAVSASLIYSFYVQASQAGTFTIGTASVEFKGKTYRTQPIKMTIVQGSAAQDQKQQDKSGKTNLNIADNVYIQASADRQQVLKGEQVTVTYKLYTRLDISSPQISKLPSYQGFWAEELETANRITFSTEVVNGKQFRVGVLKKAALFPTQTGQLSVTPFELLIPVMVPKQRRRGDIFDEFFNDPFFNQAQTVEFKATSNVLKINVLPLPEDNVPASFNGAVGNFSLNATLDRNTTKTNEPVTLKYTLSGTGNIKLADLPELELPAGFEKYEPKVSEQISRSNRISGQKTIEYLIVPRIQGEKEIPSVEFSYFNPASKKYITVSAPSFKLNIEKGDGKTDPSLAGFSKEDVRLLGEDIRFIKTSTDDLNEKKNVYVIYQPWFWVMSVIPLFMLSGIVVWKKREEKLSGNVRLLKFQRAEKLALNRLKSAKSSLDKNNQQEFYSEISLALFGYLEDKFHIEKSEFTLDYALSIMRQKNFPDELINEVQKSVEQCEYARFAPAGNSGSAMKDMYDRSIKIIVDIEKNIITPRKEAYFKERIHELIYDMKKILFIILLTTSCLFGTEAERLMLQANKYYQNSEFDKAADSYIQVLHNGYESDALYYNLGNAYFKLGRLGYAILYYEKALKLSPNDDDINYNLAIAYARSVDKIEVLPKLFFIKWWDSFLNIFSVSGWSYLTYFIYLLLLVSIALYFIVRRQTLQKIAVFTGASLIVLFIISTIVLISKLNYETNTNNGIVVEQIVTAKLSPDGQSGDAFIIHEGIKVGVEDQVSDWIKIKLPDGKVGWIPDTELRKI